MKCSLVLFSAFIYQHKHTVKVLAKSDATLLVFDLAFIISVARHCNTAQWAKSGFFVQWVYWVC